jgi:hypothetical protein
MLKRLAALNFVFLTVIAKAQMDSGIVSVYQPAINNAIAVYHQFRGDALNLYKGPAQEQYSLSESGNPYFGNGDWSSGSVYYEGVLYDHVSLKYDLARDELVVLNPNSRNAFYLFKPRVDWFTLGNKTFINLKKDGNKTLPPEGYYEQLAKGPITLLQKYTKSYQEKFSVGNVEKRFDEKNRFYAVKDNVYHRLSKAKSLYALTGNLESQIKDQIKKEGVNPKNFTEATLTTIARLYNQLSQ